MNSREIYLQGKAANKALHNLVDERTRKWDEERVKNRELQARIEVLEKELALKGQTREQSSEEKLTSFNSIVERFAESLGVSQPKKAD